jgi:hypothetical protein
MKIKKLFFLLLLAVVACNERSYTEKEYFDSNVLKSISYYCDDSIQKPYSVVLFDSLGIMIDSSTYNAEGNLHGLRYSKKTDYSLLTGYNDGGIYYKDVMFYDGERIEQHFRNDTMHGVERFYDIYKRLYKEILWTYGDRRILRDIIYSPKGDTVFSIIHNQVTDEYTEINEITKEDEIVTIISITGDTTFSIGSITFHPDYRVFTQCTTNSYINIVAADTIEEGDPLNITIYGYFGNIKDVSWDVIYQNIDKANTLNCFKTVKPLGKDSLSFDFEDYHLGYNTIIGDVLLKRDTVLVDRTSFFYDFYVEKKK